MRPAVNAFLGRGLRALLARALRAFLPRLLHASLGRGLLASLRPGGAAFDGRTVRSGNGSLIRASFAANQTC